MTDHDLDRVPLSLEAGRAIRPYLLALAGDQAAAIDTRLADLLTRDDLAGVDNAILDLLEPLSSTRNWVSGFWRSGGIPPEVVRSVARRVAPEEAERQVRRGVLGGGAPGGDPVIVIAGRRYACPQGDFVWYRVDGAENIPQCPTHKVPLEPKG
jgi:hypothetical protein